MSQIFAVVCHETRQYLAIGQGWGSLHSLWYGDAATMELLNSFLRQHEEKNIVFLCLDKNENVYDYNDWNTEIDCSEIDCSEIDSEHIKFNISSSPSPCSRCLNLNQKIFKKIKGVRPLLIPLHDGCTCYWTVAE